MWHMDITLSIFSNHSSFDEIWSVCISHVGALHFKQLVIDVSQLPLYEQ
jgi:hypothetical protein